MTIHISIKQVCNVGGEERELTPKDLTNQELKDHAMRGGWRELKTTTHICPDCIEKVVDKRI